MQTFIGIFREKSKIYYSHSRIILYFVNEQSKKKN